ncbi:hypothetical protein D3C72_1261000 [compost metagenome]
MQALRRDAHGKLACLFIAALHHEQGKQFAAFEALVGQRLTEFVVGDEEIGADEAGAQREFISDLAGPIDEGHGVAGTRQRKDRDPAAAALPHRGIDRAHAAHRPAHAPEVGDRPGGLVPEGLLVGGRGERSQRFGAIEAKVLRAAVHRLVARGRDKARHARTLLYVFAVVPEVEIGFIGRIHIGRDEQQAMWGNGRRIAHLTLSPLLG